jgi:hypothetical protein
MFGCRTFWDDGVLVPSTCLLLCLFQLKLFFQGSLMVTHTDPYRLSIHSSLLISFIVLLYFKLLCKYVQD